MARPARPERSRSARSSRQLSRFYHSINPDRVFGTHSEVEMGIAQASEIAAVPGAQVVGPLPGDLNSAIVFAVGIGSMSKDPAAAKSLIELLTSPTGAAVLKSKGMDPA